MSEHYECKPSKQDDIKNVWFWRENYFRAQIEINALEEKLRLVEAERDDLIKQMLKKPGTEYIPATHCKSAFTDMAMDESSNGTIPHFVITCNRHPLECDPNTALYCFRLDYDCSTSMFDRKVCPAIIYIIQNILHFVSQGNRHKEGDAK